MVCCRDVAFIEVACQMRGLKPHLAATCTMTNAHVHELATHRMPFTCYPHALLKSCTTGAALTLALPFPAT
jgi:hypothetical protein